MLPTTVIQWACLFQNNKQTKPKTILVCFVSQTLFLTSILFNPSLTPKNTRKKFTLPYLKKKKKKSVLCKSLILLMETFAVVVVALTVTLSIRTNLKGLRPIFHMILERSSLSLELFIFFL